MTGALHALGNLAILVAWFVIGGLVLAGSVHLADQAESAHHHDAWLIAGIGIVLTGTLFASHLLTQTKHYWPVAGVILLLTLIWAIYLGAKSAIGLFG